MIGSKYDLTELYEYYQDYLQMKTKLVLLDKEDFLKKIIEEKIVFVSKDMCINGFLSANLVGDRAYVTLVFGNEDVQEELIKTLEETVVSIGIFEIWFHFFNPTNLAWYPKPNIIHPGIQGVILDSILYQILRQLGYTDNSYQQTFYQDLKEFDMSDYSFKPSRFRIDFYDSSKHQGLTDFARKIGVKSWHDEIMYNQNLEKPLPLLVALDENLVVGFTGPLKVESNGRGYFAGIGILEEYRKNGIGKLLFYNLCQELKNLGSKYMTFFTGTTNPARYIYLSAGFHIVETFVTMKKNIVGR